MQVGQRNHSTQDEVLLLNSCSVFFNNVASVGSFVISGGMVDG